MQIEVIGVKFESTNQIYSFDPNGLDLKIGDYVLVETEKGSDLGRIAKEKQMIDEKDLISSLKKVTKKASDEVVKKAKAYAEEAGKLLPTVRNLTKQLKLEMKIVKIEASYDNNRYIINFTAENRVDFRELVKKLAESLKKRVELRQIGSRDEVRILGGFGPCGKVCCCSENISCTEHVSMKMAKNQNLSLNPANISGLCGKLMCCLSYENPYYQESIKLMPKIGTQVSTKDGKGIVAYNNLLDRKVDIKFKKGEEFEIKTYDLLEVNFKKETK